MLATVLLAIHRRAKLPSKWPVLALKLCVYVT